MEIDEKMLSFLWFIIWKLGDKYMTQYNGNSYTEIKGSIKSIIDLLELKHPIDGMTMKRVISLFLEPHILKTIYCFRSLWQREAITLEELDQYTDSLLKIKKELV